jgi:hypothetical protein
MYLCTVHYYKQCHLILLIYIYKYRVFHKSLRDCRPLRYISRDGHAEDEHVKRGRDTASFCPTLQVLDMSFLLCISWLLRSQVRKCRRILWITLYKLASLRFKLNKNCSFYSKDGARLSHRVGGKLV